MSDHHAIVLAQERFERGGRVLDLNRVLVYHIRDGKLAECWLYDQDQARRRRILELNPASLDFCSRSHGLAIDGAPPRGLGSLPPWRERRRA